MNFAIGEVLTKAWQITWKHKVLWLFGILVSLGQVLNLGNNGVRLLGQSNILPPDLTRQFVTLTQGYGFWVAFAGGLCIMMVLLILASTIGQISIIKGAAMADQGEESLSFGQVFRAARPFFWRVFWFSLIVGLVFFFIFMIFFALLAVMVTLGVAGSAARIAPLLGLGLLCLIPFTCLIVLISFAISPVLMESTVAIVVDDLGIPAAIAKAWRVVRANVGSIILVAFLVYIFGVAIGMVIAFPTLVVLLPLMTLGAGSAASQTSTLIAVTCLCAYVPVLLLLQSVFTVYMHSIWTLTYVRLTAPALAAPVAAPETARAG